MTARTDEDSAFTGLMILIVAMLALLIIGFALGVIYCEYRSVSDFRQLTAISQSVADAGEQCVSTLGDVTRAAIVLARNEKLPRAASGTNPYKVRHGTDTLSLR